MEELRDIEQIYSSATSRFNQYEGKDFVLPQNFKDQVKEIYSYSITYNKYSAVIETKGGQNGIQNIFMPNQWFYIATYFIECYNELLRYKKEAQKVVSKERFSELKKGSELTVEERNNLNNLDLSDISKSYLEKFITDYSWWSGAKTIDRGDFYVSPILNCARLVNASQSFVADLCAFLSNKEELVKAIILGEESREDLKINNDENKELPLQQIFYGAPGTGKSHKIKENKQVKKAEEKKLVFRTTFHPDSDYSTFVGAYKPTMKPVDDKYKAVAGKDEEITYSFVPQAFLQSYVAAWKKQDEKVFLIIEEINRGNCAQIFGDLFQLLDRDENGVSEYKIKADADIKTHLEKELGQDSDGIKDGELCLPKNLYIWATMNTSDQSLFPIDSAFKRRWDWKYVKIKNEHKDWKVDIDIKTKDSAGNETTAKLDWYEFIDKINEIIASMTSSADKQLGYFFCKPKTEDSKEIDAETFVSKVIFYLWNDVFKDYAFEDASLFQYTIEVNGNKETKDLTFPDFYNDDESINTTCLTDFIEKVMNWKKGNEDKE